MKTIEIYASAEHEQFTHEFVKIKNTLFIIYKNKGYFEDSDTYDVIFEISFRENRVKKELKFKTQKEVVSYLTKLKN